MAQTWLLVDAGNSRIKWALLDSTSGVGEPGRWQASGTAPAEQAEQLEDAWRGLDISVALVSNVAGPQLRTMLEQIFSRLLPAGVTAQWMVSAPELAGVRNAYRQPQQLGTDRLASAIGARALFPAQALLVVTCGTATTIDAVSADGIFRGGMILPGLSLMARALARHTAQLPEVSSHQAQAALFADNTEDAIAGGCIAAQAGAVEKAYAALLQQSRAADVQCVVSGGGAASILPHLALPYVFVDNLVLIGLQTIAHQSLTPPC
jgi:type III pantothenate kinase